MKKKDILQLIAIYGDDEDCPFFSYDEEEYDATELAHPAWWRGQHYCAKVLFQKINKITGCDCDNWTDISKVLRKAFSHSQGEDKC